MGALEGSATRREAESATSLERICVVGLRIARNSAGGNMQVWKNTGPSEISNNTIADTLQCWENDPQPVGGGNVARMKEGQCAVL